MDYSLIAHRCRLGIAWLLMLVSQASGQQQRSLAFFNSTSSLQLPTVLSLRAHIAFSFRTCSWGSLVSQQGTTAGDALTFAIAQSGRLTMSWRYQGAATESVTLAGEKSFSDNQWYTVDSTFLLGVVTVTVEQGSQVISEVVVSNSTLRPYLWDLDLSGGVLTVGEGYVGCMQEGPSVRFGGDGVVEQAVTWGECPLAQGRGCGELLENPCWQYPCQNGGTCLQRGAAQYYCQCTLFYSGPNCENDLASETTVCSLGPCENGATCHDEDTGTRKYRCQCATGFTGINCEIDIDECVSRPCNNGARCRDQVDAYTCDCTGTGYEGETCSENINECTSAPCANNAECLDSPGSYKCQCPPGFHGKNCDQGVDVCESSPCQYGGTCTSEPDSYTCQCPPGTTGNNCQVNIDDCVGAVCDVAGTECVDGLNEFFCQCRAGFKDPFSSTGSATQCVDIDECSSMPCYHGATCVNEENRYVCECVPGYTGVNCESDVDECLPNPCRNDASCVNGVNDFRCQCQDGYTGSLCETNINECASNPCVNALECKDMVSAFECVCVAGWGGDLCELQVDECQSSPCQNNARCEDSMGQFTCVCLPGFSGERCEVNINDCVDSPCYNGGTCVDGVDEYTCNCTDDWMGAHCELVYDACSFSPCQNGATCSSEPPAHDYSCECVPGFEGADCEVNINDCINHNCLAYQVCVDGVNEYTCGCPVGFTGEACSDEINECASSPCQHGGTCVDGVGQYTCQCVGEVKDLTEYGAGVYRIGYRGDNCEISIDECEYQPSICLNKGVCQDDVDGSFFKCYCPSGGDYFTGKHCEIKKDYCDIGEVEDPPLCHNGADCIDIGDDFTCQCAPGFTGPRCKINIDECASSPCMYGGTCVDGVNSYSCVCVPGLTGPHCESNINECTSQPCLNGGQCLDRINGYTCNCTDTGFSGTHCDVNIDDCQTQPCQNGATCTDGIKDFNCACNVGYEGKRCEVDVDECQSNPCQNSAICVQRSQSTRPGFTYDTAAGYDCQCVIGFEGTLCEVNIDECASDPCIHGTCQDGINSYTCVCEAGYRGRQCEINIQECVEWQPCKLGSTCEDGINDYTCTCPPTYQGKAYGGKNCSTELTGCENNDCQNGALCVPYLIDEAADLHGFTCTCSFGFYGEKCEKLTTASFSGEGWLLYDQPLNSGVSVRLRTTLSQGQVMVVGDVVTNKYVSVEVAEQGRGLKLLAVSGVSKQEFMLTTDNNMLLTDAEWLQVELHLTQPVTLQLKHADCSAGCSISVAWLDPSDFAPMAYFGGMEQPQEGVVGFIGCLQDIVINGTETLLPAEQLAVGKASPNLQEGCPRQDQCNPDPCSGNGECIDLWSTYQCQCNRPFLGTNCENSYTPATFGFENTASYASFEVPLTTWDKVRTTNQISMFFRTRKGNGLLFYLGGDKTGDNYDKTYLSAMLEGGSVVIQVRLGDAPQTFKFGQGYADGNQHFLEVNRNQNMIFLTVDEKSTEYLITALYSLVPNKHFFVGGIPRKNRRKRQTDVPELEVEGEDYKGTIQNMEQNEYKLRMFATNGTEGLLQYDEPVMVNVKEGEVTDDVCAMITPCDNNSTCVNKFFNDYECMCPDGYKGKNCSQLDFCMYTECPANSTCNDLDDGFECIAKATFNGQSSVLQYEHTLADASTLTPTVSLMFRTRETNTGIMVLYYSNRASFLRFEVKNSYLTVSFDNVNQRVVAGQMEVNDGEWHHIEVNLDTNEMKLDNLTWTEDVPQRVYFTDLIAASDIMVGSSGQEFFKGCLEEVRVGGVLLPFFSQSDIVNNTAADQFLVTDQTDIRIGCYGDPVCDDHECMNGASCVDVWNLYECSCVLGFDGRLCENNIDDCPGNECENGATCRDGIAEYFCDCVPGYVGNRCETNFDECASDPCLNNGTCVDGVNGYNCTCADNYVGDYCEYDLRENCSNSPCVNNATCVSVSTKYEGILTFNCTCVPGFTGRYCENEIDYCEGDPCLNNATCTSKRELLNFVCTCPPGYTGTQCETEINECESSPCQNDATCVDEVAQFSCLCTPGWEGAVCADNINECNMTINGTAPCENGECVDLAPGFRCDCEPGWEGDRCEVDIDECEVDQPCKNGADCDNTDGSYSCNCTLGYEGDNCETADCSAGQCVNGATCLEKQDTDEEEVTVWECLCVEHFEGQQCEIRGPCVDEPCERGTCSNTNNGTDYNCDCPQGWEGKNCSEDIDECESAPCQNDATCYNFDGGFNCTCTDAYEGDLCQDWIDFCERLKPCKNGGACKALTGSYECDCTGTGYNGTNCETDLDECLDSPCLNGATCNNWDGSYNCTCDMGYIGDVCHSADPCNDTGYCYNNGNCTSAPNNDFQNVTVRCDCHADWIGSRCEEAINGGNGGNDAMMLIIGFSVFAVLLIIFILFIIWMKRTLDKRATSGTYSPSRQEMAGARVELANGLKIPPPERLI